MKCPSCGADNDSSNRFCEQCGARIDAAPPVAASQTCPSCGAAVLPGEAFCDECGAALNNPVPVAAAAISDAPTVLASPAAPPATPSGQNIVCPACGHQNLPGDQFCDNCGAALDQPVAAPAPTPAPEPAAALVPAPAPEPAAAPAPALPDAPTVEQPMIQAPGDDAQAAYQAEQQRLNDEIGRQQKIIEQFEQMQAMFGAATPPAVTQGLNDAKAAKAAAEAALATLAPPAPPVDPAELARLNDEIGRQQKIIEQFEQMQAMFGAATPPAVTQGLNDAKAAKATAEAALAALQGGAPASSPVVSQPVEVAAPVNVPEPAKPADEAATQQQSTVDVDDQPLPPPPPLPEPVTPAPPKAAAQPRLVFDDGKELPLPTDRREVIVGREDPISGIFPEVDLTPHGGETGGVSRQHARLTHADGQWSLTDLHSTNYTRVDGARLEPDMPTPLKSGARLQFGRVAMTFQI